jgi:hypothetical protein
MKVYCCEFNLVVASFNRFIVANLVVGYSVVALSVGRWVFGHWALGIWHLALALGVGHCGCGRWALFDL